MKLAVQKNHSGVNFWSPVLTLFKKRRQRRYISIGILLGPSGDEKLQL